MSGSGHHKAALQNMPQRAPGGSCLSKRGRSISGYAVCHSGTHKCSCNIVMEQKHPTRLVTSSLWSQHIPYVRVCGDTDVSMPMVACATRYRGPHGTTVLCHPHLCALPCCHDNEFPLLETELHFLIFFKRLFFFTCFEIGSLAHAGLDFPQ